MYLRINTILMVSCYLALMSGNLIASGQQGSAHPAPFDMAEMMKKAKEFTEPGPMHRFLERFVGRWNTEFRITMGQSQPAEKGVAEFSWLIKGRWLKQEARGTIMGNPSQSFSLIGYDNFKKSFVVCSISSIDTAMNTAEGDLDPGEKVLITYGTIDEYLTGEHDKMVKTVWRFVSDDKLVQEVHDLPIGEENTKVVEVVYSRIK